MKCSIGTLLLYYFIRARCVAYDTHLWDPAKFSNINLSSHVITLSHTLVCMQITIHSTPWQIVSLILGSAYNPQTAGGHLKIRVLPWPANIVGVPTGPGRHVHISYSHQIPTHISKYRTANAANGYACLLMPLAVQCMYLVHCTVPSFYPLIHL